MFKENPTYQLAGTLAVVFAAFVLQVKNMPFLDVKERARLMREEAEQKILDEILRLERQSLLVRVNGSSYSKIMHTMRMQIEDQEKIMSKHKNDHFNLNTVELTLLGCAVTLCLSGIMFDSPFLSDGSTPLRGVVLSYFILSLIIFSMIYFVLAFVWEIKQSKIKGMKHKVVEDAKKQQKQSKLQSLLSKSKNVEKALPFNMKSLQSMIPKASVLNTSQQLEKNLNKTSSTSSPSSSVHSSSDSDISIKSGNVSLVDLLSGESSGESSSNNNSGNAKQSSSSSSASSSSAAISSSEKSDAEVSYEASSSSENEESSVFEHESQSNDSNFTVNSNS